ncbi:MAG: DUF3604 domain-containing protein [Planctomycetota bacterium]
MAVHARLEADTFPVTEPCSVEIVCTSDHELGPGDTVQFQFPHSWSLVTGPSFTRALQADDPDGEHYVQVTAPGTDAVFEHTIRPRQLNFPEHESRHGRLVTGTVERGTVPAGAEIRLGYHNTFAPYVAEEETVWVAVGGESPAEPPAIRTTAGPAEAVRLIVPSGVEPGRPFDVLAVSLDRFDNRSATTFEDRSLVLAGDGSTVADGLTFTGSTRVPVTLDKEGVYRFRMDETVSNAVKVATDCRGPYWGDIHIHTKLSGDGQGVNPYPYARDVSGLEFAAAMDHWDALGEGGYDILEAWAAADNEPGRFVTLFGDERNPPALTGHHNLYFRDLETFRKHRALPGRGSKRDPDDEAAALELLDPSRAMLIPHHTGIQFGALSTEGIGAAVNWDAWDDPGLRPACEIYSHHGQSELYAPQHCLAYEFNRMRNPERRANSSVPGPYYAQDYWMAGWRIGCLASSDQHSGQGGRRHGGVAAVRAPELTREALFDAIRRRHCYATTGERILIEFSIDDIEMGQCGQTAPGQRVDVSLRVWATDLLLKVEILRFRFGVDTRFSPLVSEAPRPHKKRHTHLASGPRQESMDAAYQLEDEITHPCMYYARVVQEPLEWPAMAWTSPIWIDCATS